MTNKLVRYLARERPRTPILVVDLDCVEAKYHAMRDALPGVDIYYAVKANPAAQVIGRLCRLGCNFDVASVAEIHSVLETGADPDRLSFGNTIKKEPDIAEAFRLGVRLFAIDSDAELRKIARSAPGSRVFCRILINSTGADWPLSRKFGCAPDMAVDLLRVAPSLGLVPYGLSFHVGSQQTDPGQWDDAIAVARAVFHELERCNVRLELLNLGGGFPASYRQPVPPLSEYGARILCSMKRHFGESMPRLIIEPGRGLVGDAGLIETEVILVASKGDCDEDVWVYVDVGKFGGLAESTDELIQYSITSHRSGPLRPVILAGPSCDSMDILYERSRYCLPEDLRIGDRLRIASAGAYTQSYSSVGFNGFPPLAAHFI
jgi:ornithine decarboxylase